MHFIDRSDCPPLLVTNQVQWTAPWIGHYRWQKDISVSPVQPPKPTDNHWLKDEIRFLLIQDFHNNCGYCGEVIPTPQNRQASKGDVDHFLPKAVYPEKVYEWDNYIWSCKPCNQQKLEFYSVSYPLLNPSCEEDCNSLVFNEDTGRYVLQDNVANEDYWKERFKNSELKTMLNSDELCRKRRNKIMLLRGRFESIAMFLPLLPNNDENLSFILQKQIDDSRAEILDIMDSPDFHLLLRDSYQSLCQKYPLFKRNLV
jgi:uncharacterized protein (TIGR02646 family)